MEVDQGAVGSTAAGSGQAPSAAADAAGAAAEASGDARPQGAAKRRTVEGTRRPVPTEFEQVATPADGNCLFIAIGSAFAVALKAKMMPTHRQTRAEVARHLRAHAADYEQNWDHELPTGETTDDFEQYAKAIQVPGQRGGTMELLAACQEWRVLCYLLMAEGNEPGYVYYDLDDAKATAYLWLERGHYTWLCLRPDA